MSNKDDDLKITFAWVIDSIAKNAPVQSPTALVGAGLISGILLHAADSALTERVMKAALNEKQLAGTHKSARQIMKLFRAVVKLHDSGIAGDEARKKARLQILGQES